MVVVVVSIVGGSEKFLYRIVRSQKPLLTVPPYDNSYYYFPTRYLYDPA